MSEESCDELELQIARNEEELEIMRATRPSSLSESRDIQVRCETLCHENQKHKAERQRRFQTWSIADLLSVFDRSQNPFFRRQFSQWLGFYRVLPLFCTVSSDKEARLLQDICDIIDYMRRVPGGGDVNFMHSLQQFERRRNEIEKMSLRVAVMMATQTRLGHSSVLNNVPSEVLRSILKDC